MFSSNADGFTSPLARQHYLAIYDELRALSPRPDVVHDVPNGYGTTRVYQHGPDHRVPVVLIHGFFLTSAMWWEQVAGLTDDFTVYTLDMLGQPGASVQSARMLTPAAAARSIDETLTSLGLRGVHLVGHSYGGWLATHMAALAPSRLATLTLIDPASTVTPLSRRCWRSFALLLSRPRSARAERAAAWIMGRPAPGSSVDTLTGLFRAGFAAFSPVLRTAALILPRDRLLRSVRLPVQVLLAGDTVHDSEHGLRRIQSVVPSWQYRLWPNASHALPAEEPDEVNACIRQFVVEHGCGR